MPEAEKNMTNTPPDISADDLQILTAWDTPTICNALELIIPGRRGLGFTTEPFVALDSSLPPICGFARTATIRAAEPSREDSEKVAADRLAYYNYVCQQPLPSIVVIQDLDMNPGIGAFWGEVQTNIHKGLGVAGCVTNGSFRDVIDSARGFQLLGGKVGPSHAFVHLVDVDCQVTVHGMNVCGNDIIHADQHGAVMIPHTAIKKIPEMIDVIARREKVILDATKHPDFCFETLKVAIGESKDIH